jgi:hypothetical protein
MNYMMSPNQTERFPVRNYSEKGKKMKYIQKRTISSFNLNKHLNMNNSHITRLSVLTVIASSLLAVGIVTALSMVEQADALTFSQSATVTQSANGANGGAGANGANGAMDSVTLQ